MNKNDCRYRTCELKEWHKHCDYCKEITYHSWGNCELCAREMTAKTKVGRVRSAIRLLIKECEDKDKDKIIIYLKSRIRDIKKGTTAFYNSNEDIELIIDNYFDRSKPLPLIRVNGCHGPVDLNNSRKRKEYQRPI